MGSCLSYLMVSKAVSSLSSELFMHSITLFLPVTHFCIQSVFFQHPFILNPTSPKPQILLNFFNFQVTASVWTPKWKLWKRRVFIRNLYGNTIDWGWKKYLLNIGTANYESLVYFIFLTLIIAFPSGNMHQWVISIFLVGGVAMLILKRKCCILK